MCSSHQPALLSLRSRLAEEDGIQPSVALTDSRQFSGLVTLATRPLLRIRKTLERRRGIEPRTPRLQLGRLPLAVAAPGTPGVIRTPNGGFGIRSPHHRQLGQNFGAPGRIRTGTARLLRPLSLPFGLQAHGRLGRIRTDTGHGLSVLPLPS